MFGFRRRKHFERTYSELVQDYGPTLHSFACKITGDERVAEGIILEVFLRLWQTRAAWSLTGNMESWLYRLTEKRIIFYLHKKSSLKKESRQLWIESIGPYSGNAEVSVSGKSSGPVQVSEKDASLQELLGETYAVIRQHSAIHVNADGRLVQALQPGVLPHFLPSRRLRRDVRVAALATAVAMVLGLAGWLTWENQHVPTAPEVHAVYAPAR